MNAFEIELNEFLGDMTPSEEEMGRMAEEAAGVDVYSNADAYMFLPLAA